MTPGPIGPDLGRDSGPPVGRPVSLPPAPLSGLLSADLQRLERLQEKAGQLVLEATLLAVSARLAAMEDASERLERLARTLGEALQDARAAARAWPDGR
jgi:hypothetical protein